MTRHFLLFMLLCCPFLAGAQDYEARWFIRNNDTLPYRILLPENYSPAKTYPLIIVMHGAGERGKDNISQLKHGGKLFQNDTLRKKFPAIVVFPQCAANAFWAVIKIGTDSAGKRSFAFSPDDPPQIPTSLVFQLTDSLLASKTIDTKRVYIGGLSMGGMGTFETLARYPNRFAAAFPICGAGKEETASRYAKNTAIWIFHGAADPVVPPASSRKYYEVLQQLKADVKYSEYPGVGHNSWENAFAEPDLLPWLFSHKLK